MKTPIMNMYDNVDKSVLSDSQWKLPHLRVLEKSSGYVAQRDSTTSSTISCGAFQNSTAGGDADKVVSEKN